MPIFLRFVTSLLAHVQHIQCFVIIVYLFAAARSKRMCVYDFVSIYIEARLLFSVAGPLCATHSHRTAEIWCVINGFRRCRCWDIVSTPVCERNWNKNRICKLANSVKVLFVTWVCLNVVGTRSCEIIFVVRFVSIIIKFRSIKKTSISASVVSCVCIVAWISRRNFLINTSRVVSNISCLYFSFVRWWCVIWKINIFAICQLGIGGYFHCCYQSMGRSCFSFAYFRICILSKNKNVNNFMQSSGFGHALEWNGIDSRIERKNESMQMPSTISFIFYVRMCAWVCKCIPSTESN